jgi:serine/threonine protein kinase
MSKLGEGSFSEVYEKNGNAVKILKKDDVSSCEINVLFALKSEFLVKGINTFVEDDKFHIEMEKLEDIIDNDFTKEELKQYFYDIVCGLKFLHDKNYVHLDLGTKNIMHKNKRGKIIDFGSSCKIEGDEEIYSINKKVTPIYRPIENLRKYKKFSKKTDVWSLGIVFIELTIGKLLYKKIPLFGKNGDICWEHTMLKYLEILNIEDEIEDDDLVDLLKNMLNFDRKKRFDINDVINHKYFSSFKYEKEINIFRMDINKIINKMELNVKIKEKLLKNCEKYFLTNKDVLISNSEKLLLRLPQSLINEDINKFTIAALLLCWPLNNFIDINYNDCIKYSDIFKYMNIILENVKNIVYVEN